MHLDHRRGQAYTWVGGGHLRGRRIPKCQAYTYMLGGRTLR
jgi:hypothetical protein